MISKEHNNSPFPIKSIKNPNGNRFHFISPVAKGNQNDTQNFIRTRNLRITKRRRIFHLIKGRKRSSNPLSPPPKKLLNIV